MVVNKEVAEENAFITAKKLLLNPEITIEMAAQTVGVSSAALSSILKEEREGLKIRLLKNKRDTFICHFYVPSS